MDTTDADAVRTVDDISTVAVLGAGNMGYGIAEVVALAGFDVRLRDIDEELVQQGYDDIEWSLEKLVEKGRLSDADADAALERITPCVDLGRAVGDADLVVEVVPEQIAIKRDVYAAVEEHAPDRAVFVTNTSSLSITDLASETERPARFCGMHFFNPPVRMELVEVIAGADTAEETLELVEAFAERLGKTPVRVRKDSPGFLVNRVLVPLLNESAWLVETGTATREEVDSTVKYDLGLPMGSFELADQVGLDVMLHVLEHLHEELGDAYEPCPLLSRTVAEGTLGKKTGSGFYSYEDPPEIPPDAVRTDVRERLVPVMANEVAGLVANDVSTPSEIDRAMTLGAGFPDGPAKLADEAGLDRLVEELDDAHDETGAARYAVVDHLRDLAATDETFHDDATETYETLSVDRRDSVGVLTLDRPHRLNSITAEMVDELDTALSALETADGVRAVLLTGAGDRAFSSGADLGQTASTLDARSAVDLSRRGQRVFGRFESSPLPVVAAIDGLCLGGGLELAACADLRVASPASSFGLPEHSLGLMPGWGGTQRLSRLIGESRAKELIFTAERFDAETMVDFGFVNRLFDDEFDVQALAFARDLASGPPVAQAATKRVMDGSRDLTAGLEAEAQAFGHVFDTDDAREGLAAFSADRDPDFVGE